MADRRDPSGLDAALYQQIIEAGELASALQGEFHRGGCRGTTTATGFPYGKDGPSVERLSDDRYVVRTADGREVGVADASGSVALVLAALDDTRSE